MFDNLKMTLHESGYTDADIMAKLCLNAEQYKNRIYGKTKWNDLQKKTVSEWLGKSEEWLFERG